MFCLTHYYQSHFSSRQFYNKYVSRINQMYYCNRAVGADLAAIHSPFTMLESLSSNVFSEVFHVFFKQRET